MGTYNKKLAISDGHGGWKLRIYHKKGAKRLAPRYLIKCGCCDEKVEIYYDKHGLEINGVNASVAEWRKILDPLLSL